MTKARAGGSDPVDDLRAELGAQVVVACEPGDAEALGLEPRATLEPSDAECLARCLGLASERDLALLVRGGGTRLGLGNPPRRADLVLSTTGLSGVDDFDADDGVAHVRAGTPLDTLRDLATQHGWELPLDPPGARSSVGGTLAAAAIGPRRLGFGAPRDCVLGLDVALASGERTRCGGRVVKNVTGYDLAKLYTGSLGTLGVIEGAWLRLRPTPERVEALMCRIAEEPALFSAGLEVARRVTARTVALLDPRQAQSLATVCPGREADPQAWLLVVELAGDDPAVERDARWLQERTGAQPPQAASDPIAELRALQGRVSAECGLRARIAVRPSALARCCARLGGFGLGLVVHPGLGLVYAESGSGADPRDGSPLRGIEEAAREGGGSFVVEECPGWQKQGRDVFGDAGASLALHRALKERFDPVGVLNPGRFIGGL